jgi:hypothetical protein
VGTSSSVSVISNRRLFRRCYAETWRPAQDEIEPWNGHESRQWLLKNAVENDPIS